MSDWDYEIDNTIQFIIETVEMKLNQLSDENEELKKRKWIFKKKMRWILGRNRVK